MATRPEQIADAMLLIAEANHYMVGLTEEVTLEETQEAMQILITRQNKVEPGITLYSQYDLAIDLLEVHEKKILRS